MSSETHTQVIRTSRRYWLQEVGWVIFLFTVFPIVAMIYLGPAFYSCGGMFLIGAVVILPTIVRPAYKACIMFTDGELQAHALNSDFRELKDSIQAVLLAGHRDTLQLTVWADEQVAHIPCRYFDENELNKLLRENLPSSVLDPRAYQATRKFQEWQRTLEKEFDHLSAPLKVSVGDSERLTGGITIAASLVLFVLSIIADEGIPGLIMSFIPALLGTFLVVWSVGKIEATNEAITLRTAFRKHTLPWNTLREVHISPSIYQVIALVGDKSRIVMPGPVNWSGPDGEKLQNLLFYKLEVSGLKLIESRKHLYWRSKNFEK